MHWLPLTLICAFCLASADAATKRWLQDYSVQELALIRFTFTGLLITPLMLLTPLPHLPLEFWYWITALLPAEIIAMLLYMQAIRDHPLSLTLPYMAFTPVFITLTGELLLGEQISAGGFAGILLIVSGAWVLNLESGNQITWRQLHAPLTAIARNKGSRLMILAAILYSFTATGSKAAMQYMPPEQFGPLYFAIVGTVSLALFSLQQPGIGRVIWRRPAATLLIGILMGIMVFTHFIAIQKVEVAYMIAVKRTSLLFGILYGALLFKEQGLTIHLIAGCLMVAGIALIVF
jgi:drug/metabolite transporter (DMT)-like permease